MLDHLIDERFKNSIQSSNGSALYDLYELCIEYGIEIDETNNPFLCFSERQFNERKKKIATIIKKHKMQKLLPKLPSFLRDLKPSIMNKMKSILQFEANMTRIGLQRCPCCLSESLIKKTNTSSINDKMCAICLGEKQRNKYNSKSPLTRHEQQHVYLLKNEILPVWYKHEDILTKKNPQYHIPEELSSLTDGEILLIQRYSPLVPVFHMSKGTTGIRGHCVCFVQDSNSVCNELPRKKCNIVKVIKTCEYENETSTTHFTVNRDRVLTALHWLKVHHKYYTEIEINANNLSWMKDKAECEMDDAVLNVLDDKSIHVSRGEENITVSEIQTHLERDANNIEIYGVTNNTVQPSINNTDKQIFDDLHQVLKDSNYEPTSYMNFPDIQETAVCEYSEDILPNIFPHLYPGGIGGHNNHYNDNVNLQHYAKRLLNYYDGRFSSDKVWSYYLLDMIQRRKNNKDGNYVIKQGFLGDVCQTVEDLKQQIKRGNLSWIDMLRNFSKRIRGSDNYWRTKRQEVETWINFHVEQGHGPPSLFLTLSCAENWWYDLQRILQEKVQITTNHHLLDQLNSPTEQIKMAARSKVSTLYSSIVQEFFQLRVKEWLETVGRTVFDIKHYWGRFEFAKGRGQIHLHLLAITKNRNHQHEYYRLKKKNRKKEADQRLADYAREQLGLIAEHPGLENKFEQIKNHPNVSHT